MSPGYALRGNTILTLWGTAHPTAADEDTLNQWWSFEHVPERLSLPGFQRARRYHAAGSNNESKYLVLYEGDTSEVFRSSQYVRQLNEPTPATSKHMPTIMNWNRYVSEVVFSKPREELVKLGNPRGSVTGGGLLHVWFSPPPNSSTVSKGKLQNVIEGKCLAGLMELSSTVSVHFVTSNCDITSGGSKSASFNGTNVESTEEKSKDFAEKWMVLVEFALPTHSEIRQKVEDAIGSILLNELNEKGAQDIKHEIYQLILSCEN